MKRLKNRFYPVMDFVVSGGKPPKGSRWWCIEGGKVWWRIPYGSDDDDETGGSTSGKPPTGETLLN